MKRATADLRRRFRLRLPDAIIAVTAMALDAELLTNDSSLSQVASVRTRRVALKPR